MYRVIWFCDVGRLYLGAVQYRNLQLRAQRASKQPPLPEIQMNAGIPKIAGTNIGMNGRIWNNHPHVQPHRAWLEGTMVAKGSKYLCSMYLGLLHHDFGLYKNICTDYVGTRVAGLKTIAKAGVAVRLCAWTASTCRLDQRQAQNGGKRRSLLMALLPLL